MKTTKLILSIALVALGTISFGQRSFNIERLFPNKNKQVAHFIADKNVERSRIEFWMHDTQGWPSKKVSYDVYEAPVVARTLYVEQVEVLYEEKLRLESWMVVPFETGIAEEELNIESWMTAPFEIGEDLEIESWMTTVWI